MNNKMFVEKRLGWHEDCLALQCHNQCKEIQIRDSSHKIVLSFNSINGLLLSKYQHFYQKMSILWYLTYYRNVSKKELYFISIYRDCFLERHRYNWIWVFKLSIHIKQVFLLFMTTNLCFWQDADGTYLFRCRQ